MTFDSEKIKEIIREFPGLTSRQIAKKLGDVEKTDLNRFLYRDCDGVKQIDYKWYLDDEYVLELGGRSWINEKSFESNLTTSGSLLDSNASKCTIRFLNNCQILLIATARIIALVNQAILSKKDVKLDFSKSPKTKNYLDRLGFFDHIHPEVIIIPKLITESRAEHYRGNSDTLVEVAAINLDNFDYLLPKQLTEKFVEHAGEKYHQAAFTIFSELIGNVQDHSKTPIPGFAALQLYRGTRHHIQTVISDNGLGIATTLMRSLERHYPDLFEKLQSYQSNPDIYLVEQALKNGGLSQFGSGRGLGIKSTQREAAKYNARVIIRQSNFELEVMYQDGIIKEINKNTELVTINGTQVCFDFFLD